MVNLNDFLKGSYFEVKIAGGNLYIYRDGVEYSAENAETGDVGCWSKLNFVEPEVWVDVYPTAVNLYNDLFKMNDLSLNNWLAEFKTDAVYEIL